MRSVAIFFAGFVAGIVFLAVLRWQTAPQASAEPQMEPGMQPSSQRVSQRVAEVGEPRLSIPVQGIPPRDLHDDFDEVRGGHRHEAIDIMAPRGTPVLAADEGTVAKLFLSKPGGITVYQFNDAETYCYYYAHLDRYAEGLQQGKLLRRGDVLGYVGSTGDAQENAPHLHFAVFRLGPEKHWWQGTALDPFPMLVRQAS